MKRVLIISPYFPPTNAADMQRIRMSLPYFAQFGWEAEVVTVDEQYSDLPKDDLLKQSLPPDLKIHQVKALPKSITSKLGLGSIALRSLWFYWQKVNKLFNGGGFDLVYFSTTQFPVCILGRYWKERFGIPYVIDMQDPWHSNYYQQKPKNQRPPKYWFSYRLNKYLEPVAMKAVDGLISVSEKYINDLQERYPRLKNIPVDTITFGAYQPDTQIARDNENKFEPILDSNYKNLVYIGRGGADMHQALSVLFNAFKTGKQKLPVLFKKLKLTFIGTSYAPAGQGVPTILPLADEFGLKDDVTEITDRISYYHTLAILQKADGVFIPGSDSSGYTASKIYPYLSNAKPMLAIINSKSPAVEVLRDYSAEHFYFFDEPEMAVSNTEFFLTQLLNDAIVPPQYNPDAIEQYSAQNMTRKQCLLFNQVVNE